MSKQPSAIERSVDASKTFQDKVKDSEDVHVTTS